MRSVASTYSQRMSSSEPGEILGLHHVKLAVTDLQRSRAWYERVFRLEPMLEWPDAEGVVRGVRYRAKGAFALALRENETVALATPGFDPFAILVRGQEDVEAWARRLDDLGIAHTPVRPGAEGYLLSFEDPDGLQLKIYSEDSHNLSSDQLPSAARPVDETATT